MRPSAAPTPLGLCLALVAWALLLAGCGGGSSSPDPQSSTGEASTEAATAPATVKPKRAASTEKAASGSATGAGGEREGSGGSGAKHGPRVPQPKGEPEPQITPTQRSEATVADMTLESPAIQAGGTGEVGALPSRYTCDGEDTWPELRWGAVPQGTAELAIYAMSVQPVEGRLFVDWAVAGIDPSAEGIEAAQLPKGAILATNSFGKRGYSICPEQGKGEIYMFAAYALPQSLALSPGFDARETRQRILDASGDVGLLPAGYSRP